MAVSVAGVRDAPIIRVADPFASHDVVRFLKPRPEFVVQIRLSLNCYVVSSPPRPVIHRLDNARAVQPAVQRKAGEEVLLTWLKSCRALQALSWETSLRG